MNDLLPQLSPVHLGSGQAPRDANQLALARKVRTLGLGVFGVWGLEV